MISMISFSILMKKQCDIYETEATVYHAHTCNTIFIREQALFGQSYENQCIIWNFWNKTYLSLISGVRRILFKGGGGGGGSIFQT